MLARETYSPVLIISEPIINNIKLLFRSYKTISLLEDIKNIHKDSVKVGVGYGRFLHLILCIPCQFAFCQILLFVITKLQDD